MRIQTFCLCFSLVLLVSSCSTIMGDYDWEMDTYAGMTLAQVVELLGKPKYVDEFIIDDNTSITPDAPRFFVYFSKEELETGVKITYAYWTKGKYEILVWLRNKDDELIVFTSKKQRRRIRSPFIVYL